MVGSIDKEILKDFLSDFRDALAEYVRESVYELQISELRVTEETVKLFDGYTPGKVRIKNQGSAICFVGTSPLGGYRLDPSESIDFFVNTTVYATTISGHTSLGFIKV